MEHEQVVSNSNNIYIYQQFKDDVMLQPMNCIKKLNKLLEE